MRLADLMDYDAALISKGGGVYARTDKVVKLSQEAATVLGLGSADQAVPAADPCCGGEAAEHAEAGDGKPARFTGERAVPHVRSPACAAARCRRLDPRSTALRPRRNARSPTR
mgnify:CR=1 FL=1